MQVEIVNTKNIFLSNARKSDITKFENGKVREEYRQLLKEGKMILEQLREVLNAKKNEAVQEVVTGAYKDKKYALQGKDKLDKNGNVEYNKNTLDNVFYEKKNDGKRGNLE